MAVYELITEVLGNLDASRLTMGIFCDLAKAFESIQHEILLMKLQYYGFDGLSIKFFQTYLTGRFQRVKIRDACGQFSYSEWGKVSCGVPQGSLLGPLLFIIYINDLPANVPTKLLLFADDTTAIVRGSSPNELSDMSKTTVGALIKWFQVNGMAMNCTKTNLVPFSAANGGYEAFQVLSDSGELCSSAMSVRFLGINLDSSLSWSSHIDSLVKGLGKALFALRSLNDIVDEGVALMVYHGYFLSRIRYGILFWGCSSNARAVLMMQKRALRCIFRLNYRESCRSYFKSKNLLTVPALYIYELLSFMKNNFHYYSGAIPRHNHATRNLNLLNYPIHRLSLFERGPYYMGLRVFNGLPTQVKVRFGEKDFLIILKKYLVDLCPYNVNEGS
jgi:hypothetical protein